MSNLWDYLQRAWDLSPGLMLLFMALVVFFGYELVKSFTASSDDDADGDG